MAASEGGHDIRGFRIISIRFRARLSAFFDPSASKSFFSWRFRVAKRTEASKLLLAVLSRSWPVSGAPHGRQSQTLPTAKVAFSAPLFEARQPCVRPRPG